MSSRSLSHSSRVGVFAISFGLVLFQGLPQAQAMFRFGAQPEASSLGSRGASQSLELDPRRRQEQHLERARSEELRRQADSESVMSSIEERHRKKAEEARAKSDPISVLKAALDRRVLAFTQEVKRGEDGKPILEEGAIVYQTPKVITGLLDRVTQVQSVSRSEVTFQSENGVTCPGGKRFCLTQHVFPAVAEFRGLHLGDLVDIEYNNSLEDPENPYFSEYYGLEASDQNRVLPKDSDLFGETLAVGVGFCQGRVTGLFFRNPLIQTPYLSSEADGLIEVDTFGCYGYDPVDGSYISLPEMRKIKYWKFTSKVSLKAVAEVGGGEAAPSKHHSNSHPVPSAPYFDPSVAGGGGGGDRVSVSDPSAPRGSSGLYPTLSHGMILGTPVYPDYISLGGLPAHDPEVV